MVLYRNTQQDLSDIFKMCFKRCHVLTDKDFNTTTQYMCVYKYFFKLFFNPRNNSV